MGRDQFRVQCESALASHLSEPGEATRLAGYALGRSALEAQLPLLDFVTLLQGAVLDSVRRAPPGEEAGVAAAGGDFLLECCSPYEMAFRAAREANGALRRQNELLEESARRMAHAVHDSSGQLLAAVHGELHQAVAVAPPSMRLHLQRAHKLLNGVEADLRRLSHDLRPTILDDLGLLPALRTLAKGVTDRTGLAVTVDGSCEARLPPPVEIAIYRTVQEALTNVSKHARARSATVRVDLKASEVRCSIADDGVGFESTIAADGSTRGLGLVGMRERLAALGGSLQHETGAGGRGARLIAVVPLEVPYASPRPGR